MRNKVYEAPRIEWFEIEVEQGFNLSVNTNPGGNLDYSDNGSADELP